MPRTFTHGPPGGTSTPVVSNSTVAVPSESPAVMPDRRRPTARHRPRLAEGREIVAAVGCEEFEMALGRGEIADDVLRRPVFLVQHLGVEDPGEHR